MRAEAAAVATIPAALLISAMADQDNACCRAVHSSGPVGSASLILHVCSHPRAHRDCAKNMAQTLNVQPMLHVTLLHAAATDCAHTRWQYVPDRQRLLSTLQF